MKCMYPLKTAEVRICLQSNKGIIISARNYQKVYLEPSAVTLSNDIFHFN